MRTCCFVHVYKVLCADCIVTCQVIDYESTATGKPITIVTYGNGVVTSLRARRALEQQHGLRVRVVDSPYLSRPSAGLKEVLAASERVVFVDVCKEGQHPFAGIITRLQSDGALPSKWQCVAAQPTYNPLGNVLTFTSEADVIAACVRVSAM